MAEPNMTGTLGQRLHQALQDKWGCSYDLQLRRVQDRIVLLVMWKYLEQVSFRLSPAAYGEHLEQIANYLAALGVFDQVVEGIATSRDRPRVGKAVSLSLALDLGDRASEWLLDS
jgi:hypothetical protein